MSLIRSICPGWISDFPLNPSRRACSASRRRPSWSATSGQIPSIACRRAAIAATTTAERAYRSSLASPSRAIGSERSRAKSSAPKSSATTRSEHVAIACASSRARADSIEGMMRIEPRAIPAPPSRSSSSLASLTTSSAWSIFGATMPSRPGRTAAARSASHAWTSLLSRTYRAGLVPAEGSASTAAIAARA